MTTGTPKPGRELDALVAEKVMGWRNVREKVYSNGERDWLGVHPTRAATFTLRHYSTDMNDAWQVVERLREVYPKGWASVLTGVGEGFCVSVSTGDREHGATEPTAPHAICLAALAACGRQS